MDFPRNCSLPRERGRRSDRPPSGATRKLAVAREFDLCRRSSSQAVGQVGLLSRPSLREPSAGRRRCAQYPGRSFTAFAKHGGKLIIYHGWADMPVTPQLTTLYYDAIARHAGGVDANWLRVGVDAMRFLSSPSGSEI
jgi:hypothetical protein